jgi:anaerobic magnesium-protoporphyrin IX monomethyl ester cyclase
MQILLTTLNAKYIHSNLAIRILYSLNKDYEGLQWKEFTINEPQEPVVEFCCNFEVVAFSCYIWNITQTLELIEKIKTCKPSIKIMLGGPEVSYDWQELIGSDNIDYIITGEGEIPFAQFLQHYPFVDLIPNLVSKVGKDVIYHSNAETFDLQKFEHIMPYAYDEPTALYNKVLYLETSRGCPYKCEFCLASLDNKVRYLPNTSIKETLLYLMQHGRVIKFLDRTFNIKKDFTIDMFQFILEHHRPENVFQFEITADIVHPDIIAFIQEHVPPGLFRFEIGIQTVNQKANLEVSRKQNFDKTKGVIEKLSNKIEMHLDLIVGLPLDYFEDIKYSIEEVFKLFAPELQLGFLKFLKGTPVRDKHEQHGYIFDPLAPYQIIESNYLSKTELENIVKLEHALEIYWNKARAINSLKYVTHHYSIFDFLLGLGTYFGTKHAYHKYTLQDVFDILFEYANMHFANDKVLMSLIAIDYYSFYKIKPKALYSEPISGTAKQQIIDRLQLNHHKYRHIVLTIPFDYDFLINENIVKLHQQSLVIEYNGNTKPALINPTSQIELIAS